MTIVTHEPAPGSSAFRVREAAAKAGLDIAIRRMSASTRTAAEAAAACGCALDQIVKSLIFADDRGKEPPRLALVLAAGSNVVDLEAAGKVLGMRLGRANGRMVRKRTGFAIGGVAPFGHLEPLPTLMDERLFDFPVVWAAAGGPDLVFEITPQDLQNASGAIRSVIIG